MEETERRHSNLRPYPKGVSGNPKGRPKVPDLSSLIYEEVGEQGFREAIQALLKQAKKGNVKAIQELLDRAYGKTTLPVDHTSKGERITSIRIVDVDGTEI